MKFKSILLIGPPGTGKTTVAHIIGESKGYKHYSNGEERRKLSSQNKLNPEITTYMNEGLPIPAKLLIKEVIKIINKYIKEGLYNPNADTLLLDGLPRDEAQLIELKKYFNIYKVFTFFVNKDAIIFKRIQTKRDEKRIDDSKQDIIKKRIGIVNKKLDSILLHFDKKQIIKVNSENNTIGQMVNLVRNNL